MNFKKVTFKVASYTQDSLGERVKSLSSGTTIEMVISFLSGNSNSINSVLTASSTHIGLTRIKTIKQGDCIVDSTNSYKVDFVNNAPRLSVVYMSLERSYE